MYEHTSCHCEGIGHVTKANFLPPEGTHFIGDRYKANPRVVQSSAPRTQEATHKARLLSKEQLQICWLLAGSVYIRQGL